MDIPTKVLLSRNLLFIIQRIVLFILLLKAKVVFYFEKMPYPNPLQIKIWHINYIIRVRLPLQGEINAH